LPAVVWTMTTIRMTNNGQKTIFPHPRIKLDNTCTDQCNPG
jgi:hypothetical protein